MSSQAPVYPVGAVASLLKVSRAVCLKLIKDGDLEAQRTPQGLRIEHGRLVGWINARIQQAALEGHGLAKEPQKK